MSALPSIIHRPTSSWLRAVVPLIAMLAAIGALHRDTALAMVSIWDRSDTFAHCWLVPPIVLWLIWRQRESLASLRPRSSPPMLLALAAAACVWLLSDLAAVDVGAQFAFVAMLVIAVMAVLGSQVARALMFPLGFAFFAVPVGEFTMPTLMAWTADFVVAALQLSGIPVFREGLQFVIPSGNWSVVEACSGVRYLIASVMVGTLFAYLNYTSLRRRWLFVGVSIVVPVLANWVRAYLIVLLGHVSSNELATGWDHLVYGWVFFGVVIVIMFVVGARWSEPPTDSAVAPAPRLPSDTMAGWVPVLSTALAAVLIAALPLQALRNITAAEAAGPVRLSLPSAIGTAWTRTSTPPEWSPAFRAPRADVTAGFDRGGASVGLYLAYYRHQGQDSKLVSSENMFVRSKDPKWQQLAVTAPTVQIVGAPFEVRQAQLRSLTPGSERRLLAWQFYRVDGHWMASDTETKLRGAWQRLRGRGDDGAAVVIHTVDDGSPAATAALIDFIGQGLPALARELDKAADGR